MSWADLLSLTLEQVLLELGSTDDDSTLSRELKVTHQVRALLRLAELLKITPFELASRGVRKVAGLMSEHLGTPVTDAQIEPLLCEPEFESQTP